MTPKTDITTIQIEKLLRYRPASMILSARIDITEGAADLVVFATALIEQSALLWLWRDW